MIFYEKLTHKTKTIARFLSCFNICVYIVHIIFNCLHLFIHFYIRSFIYFKYNHITFQILEESTLKC